MEYLEIKTLEDTRTADILECFNLAFSDYQTPTKLTLSQLESKMRSENVLRKYSIGVFDGERLVGLVLHGYDVIDNKKTLYNAGTGVIPECRGQKLTERMYAFGLPEFRKAGIERIRLEVITDNLRAYKVYKRIGFDEKRTLCCYKGAVHLSTAMPENMIRKVESPDWDKLKSYCISGPTWQNSLATISRSAGDSEVWGIYYKEELAGYLAYIPDRKRVQLFAVKPECRRQRLASSLFGNIASMYGPGLSVVNIDIKDTVTNSFLLSIGLSEFARQYDMEMTV
jgi:ribosomal protein S18 acetylase RimI-like enzyme